MAVKSRYSFKDDKHPYIDAYKNLDKDKWISRRELRDKMWDKKIIISYRHVDKALEWLRKYGLIEHRIRSIRPRKGYTAEDVIKKITHGASKVNTGVLVYEYRITGEKTEEHFKRLIRRSKIARHSKPKKKKHTWRKSRIFTPEQAMYIRINPDGLSIYMLAKMFGVDKRTIRQIIKGETYKDLDMEKYLPIREEIFNQVKSDNYDFF